MRGLASAELVERAVQVMCTLNDIASRQALASGASAATDVTGFGLLGHLHELALASGCAAEIDGRALPAIEGVLELLDSEAAVAGGSRRNRADADRFVTWAAALPEPLRWLACDAMTSGGLLVAGAAVDGWPIGHLVEGEAGRIRVG